MPDITQSGTVTATGAPTTQLEAPADTATVAPVGEGSAIQARRGSVVVGGTAEVHPVTTVTGPCFELELRNVTTGERLFWHDLELEMGEELVIDHLARTATIDDVPVSTSGVEGTYWALVPGTNQLSAGATEAPTGFTVSISFREAYL